MAFMMLVQIGPAAVAPATEGSVDELERLAKLRSEDLLTEVEYAAAKGRLLPRAGA